MNRAALDAWERERNIYAGKYADERDEAVRLRSRLTMATSTIKLMQSYVSLLDSEAVPDDMQELARDEVRNAVRAFLAVDGTQP